MNKTTVIRNAAWVVAWNHESARHEYRNDVDVAITADRFSFIGEGFAGPADREIDGRHRLVLPGLVNVHAHPASEPLRKGITDEIRSPGFHHSSLYEYLTVFDNDEDGRKAALQITIGELLKSGCTTMTDLSSPHEGWLKTLADSGIRAVVAPGFRDARWFTRDGHSLEYAWDVSAGQEAFARACDLITEIQDHPCARLSAMVYPAQIDTCTPELLAQSHDFALSNDLPWQTHAAQSVTEFHEIQRRCGKTPIGFLHDIGVLDGHTIIGHGIFLDHHPWLHWTTRQDLELLAETKVSVAHCPIVFGKRGITLRTFGDYVKRGINMGIGTDTYPHNFIEEMRAACYYARICAETVDDLDTRDVFNAATVGGAHALRQADIGRIEVGCKADFSLVDTAHPSMMPLREPLRSLIYVAAERPIRDVFVDGNQVVKGGQVLNIDMQAASEHLQEAQGRSIAKTRQLDWAQRSAEQMAPGVFERR